MTRSPLQCRTSIIQSSRLVQASSSLSTGRTRSVPTGVTSSKILFSPSFSWAFGVVWCTVVDGPLATLGTFHWLTVAVPFASLLNHLLSVTTEWVWLAPHHQCGPSCRSVAWNVWLWTRQSQGLWQSLPHAEEVLSGDRTPVGFWNSVLVFVLTAQSWWLFWEGGLWSPWEGGLWSPSPTLSIRPYDQHMTESYCLLI